MFSVQKSPRTRSRRPTRQEKRQLLTLRTAHLLFRCRYFSSLLGRFKFSVQQKTGSEKTYRAKAQRTPKAI